MEKRPFFVNTNIQKIRSAFLLRYTLLMNENCLYKIKSEDNGHCFQVEDTLCIDFAINVLKATLSRYNGLRSGETQLLHMKCAAVSASSLHLLRIRISVALKGLLGFESPFFYGAVKISFCEKNVRLPATILVLPIGWMNSRNFSSKGRLIGLTTNVGFSSIIMEPHGLFADLAPTRSEKYYAITHVRNVLNSAQWWQSIFDIIRIVFSMTVTRAQLNI